MTVKVILNDRNDALYTSIKTVYSLYPDEEIPIIIDNIMMLWNTSKKRMTYTEYGYITDTFPELCSDPRNLRKQQQNMDWINFCRWANEQLGKDKGR